MYINKITNETYFDEIIMSDNDSNIVIYKDNKWRLISKDQLEDITEKEYSNGSYKQIVNDTEIDEVLTPENISENVIRYYTYYFGINSLNVAQKEYYSNSAVISNSISVDSRRDIILKADYKEPEYTSVEFYIIDGQTEIPILPQGVTEIQNEKVFFNLNTRFDGSDFRYYKNNTLVGNSVSSLGKIDNSECYVSYRPDNTGYTVSPKNDTVKIKVVLRMYSLAIKAPQVNSVMLLQDSLKVGAL